jgi:hypothetical protein
MAVTAHRDADLVANHRLPVETEARGDSRQSGIEGGLAEDEEDAEREEREREKRAEDAADIGNLEQDDEDQRRADRVDRKLVPRKMGRRSVLNDI